MQAQVRCSFTWPRLDGHLSAPLLVAPDSQARLRWRGGGYYRRFPPPFSRPAATQRRPSFHDALCMYWYGVVWWLKSGDGRRDEAKQEQPKKKEATSVTSQVVPHIWPRRKKEGNMRNNYGIAVYPVQQYLLYLVSCMILYDPVSCTSIILYDPVSCTCIMYPRIQ